MDSFFKRNVTINVSQVPDSTVYPPKFQSCPECPIFRQVISGKWLKPSRRIPAFVGLYTSTVSAYSLSIYTSLQLAFSLLKNKSPAG